MTTGSDNEQAQDGPSLTEDGSGDLSHLSIEDQVAALQDLLQESKREAGQSLNAAQRAQAELVNFRRRTDEERIALGKYANSRLISKLLPVMEELALAMNHAARGTANDSWLEGVKLIQRKLDNLLHSEGVTEIETMDTEFNPMEHEALGTVETNDHPSGYVAEVVRTGYRLYDRVIQPTQVMVAREPARPDQSEHSSESKEIEHG
jgi:molecular chaperone GrpE